MTSSWFRSLFPLLVVGGPLTLAAACSADAVPAEGKSALPSGVFGGAAGVIDPRLDAGRPDAPIGPTDVCASVPQGQVALIDDFDDGNSVAVFETDRDAYWFPVHDGTAGTMNQDSEFTPLPGGANGTPFAAHITAAGYSDWGAQFDANITHLANGIRCPYNASKFSGFRFYAKGSGNVRIELIMPDVVDVMYGGKCDPSKGQVCYDTHGTSISLTPDWQKYELTWGRFAQRMFGEQIAFDPGKIMQIAFQYEAADLPVDTWFDNVGFMDGTPFPTPSPSSGGEAGQGGQ